MGQSKRDMGGVIFIDVRDCMGAACRWYSTHKTFDCRVFCSRNEVKIESTVSVTGLLRPRSAKPIIPSLKPAQSDCANGFRGCCQADSLPFQLEDTASVLLRI